MRRRGWIWSIVLLVALLWSTATAFGWTPVPVKDDPLVRMPGTQPAPENSADIESPKRCTNCHGGYNQTIEPTFNWQGSMMAQSARDFLFYACMTTAAQDAIWAVGTPNAVDMCERCHFPKGWAEGRSDPPNASLMTGDDFDGVQCDLCHSMFDPFFETTYDGTREGSDWLNYWDETNASGTPSQSAADQAYQEDMRLAGTINLFSGGNINQPFFTLNRPPANYVESGSGQFFLDDVRDKRASFADASGRHAMVYSRYHKSKYFCSTCHDVSNPVLANLNDDPNAGALTTETDSAFSYFHVERTFSEFMLSDYGQQGGATGIGPFAPDLYNTSRPGNVIATCQDCHMRDGTGVACTQNDGVVRPTDSVEHPQSGQPIHDLTGGNAWVTTVLASAVSGSANYDATNDALLNQGPAALTLDLSQGLGLDPAALLVGADRAMQQLQMAASINNLSYDPSTGALTFLVQNQTGHKLISGFPEGRRMFVKIKAYAAGQLIHEINPYDYTAGTLKGLGASYDGQGLPAPAALQAGESYVDELVYEMKPTSALTGEDKTFHFALATGRYKDNRIPPKGFRIAQAAERLSVPVAHGVEEPNLFTAQEYAGGYDAVSLNIPAGAEQVEVSLYYQTTSREYIEFLRDEINGYSNTTNSPTLVGTGAGGDTPYLVQSDPFFGQLKAWGDTIWQLWTHNMNMTTAKPFLMASATVGGGGCAAPVPTLLTAEPGNSQVTLSWSDESATGAIGYKLYYDQAGKSVLIADLGNTTTYVDSNLTNGNQYCYKVTSYTADCESTFSNILCATPTNQGQATMEAGVTQLVSGLWTGKGNNQSFTTQSTFNAGDTVTIRATILDQDGATLEGATVDILITGPESVLVTSGHSDANGIAEASWSTKTAKGKSAGTTPGSYTATTKGVTASGYSWDAVETSTTFTIQ